MKDEQVELEEKIFRLLSQPEYLNFFNHAVKQQEGSHRMYTTLRSWTSPPPDV
jgi:hypothetical protein